MENKYDIKGLKEEMRNYLETEAIMNPLALADLSLMENADKEELLKIAYRLPIDTDRYKIE